LLLITSNRAAFYSVRIVNVWNKLSGYTDLVLLQHSSVVY